MVTDDYFMTMTRIGVAELKAKLSEHLRTVRRGGEVTVYDRSEPIARLIPYSSAGPLTVREPIQSYRTLGEIEIPPPVTLSVDAVDLLLEDRQKDQ